MGVLASSFRAMLQHDSFWWLDALAWCLGLHALAFAAWPIVSRCFRALPDRGAGLALPGGFFAYVLVSQIAWRSGRWYPHPAFQWALVAGIGLAAWGLSPPSRPSFGTLARMRRSALRSEAVFLLSFAFWSVVRSADPAIAHTEQPMDAMWLQAAMVSDAPPIRDAWFGGEPASYYTEGHQMWAFVARLMGSGMPLAYNLSQIACFAMIAVLAFQASALLAHAGRGLPDGRAGGFGIIGVLLLSNPAGAWDSLRKSSEGHWWWWGATRVSRDGDTALITEFPFFSFWLGDLHAHVLGLPILLLAVLGALQVARARRWNFAMGLPIGLALIWSWRANPWQAPACLALAGLAVLSRLPRRPKGVPSLFVAGLLPLLALAWPGLAKGMFLGIAPNTHGFTSPTEYLLVFGFFLPGLMLLCRGPAPVVRNAIALALLAYAMVAACEALVIRDLFQNRMNTVFKVYYQAWVFLALASAAGLAVAWRKGPAWLRLLAIPPALGLAYPLILISGTFSAKARSLDATDALFPWQRELIEPARALIAPGQRIAEAFGQSYDASTSMLATWTAGDGLAGWGGHLVQWHPGKEITNLGRIFLAPTEWELALALDELGVDWILAGPHERKTYGMGPDWYRWMGTLCDAPVIVDRDILYRRRP